MVYLKENYEKAIKLRKKGLSYSEILKSIPVAKSTLALWLHSVGLSKKQKQRLTDKKLASALRGAARKKEIRIQKTQSIFQEAAKDIKNISKKELFLIGVALYWAEGSKEKEYRPGSGIQFSNSDANMIKLFLKWIFEICKIPKEKIYFEIYIHETKKSDVKIVRDYWSRITEFPVEFLNRVYFKKNKINTKRKNIGDSYFGVLRIKINASSKLNRKIAGWIQAINRYYWGIV